MIRVSKLYKILIYIVTVIMLGGLQLLPKQFLGGYAFRFGVAIFGMILACFCILLRNRSRTYNSMIKELNNILVPYVFCILVSLIYTTIKYDYSMYEISIAVMPYLYVFYAYPILYVLSKENDEPKFIKVISRLTTIFVFVRLIVWILYNIFGITIFPQLLFEYGDSWIRNGALRINSGYLIGISFSFYLSMFFNSKRKLYYGFIVCFYTIFVGFIASYRFQLIVMLICIIMSFYYSTNSKRNKYQRGFFVLLVMVLLLFSPLLTDFTDSFSISNENTGGSTYLRILTIEHYFNYIVNNRCFLGTGLLIQENVNALNILTKSQWRLYYLEDIGILGGIFKLGILSIGVFSGFFYKAIENYKYRNEMSNRDRTYIITLLSYFIVSNLALNSFDLQRAYDVPFYLALFLYYRIIYKKRRIPK